MAAAVMAVSANAGTSEFIVTEKATPAQRIDLAGLTVVLGGQKCVDKAGEDNGADVWKDLKNGSISVAGVDFTNYMVSGDNARGADFAAGTSARVYGGYIEYIPSIDGTLYTVFNIPSGKGIIFSEINAANEAGTNILLGASPAAVIYNAEGTAVALDESGVAQSDSKAMAYIKAEVKAGSTYYFSFSGSKTSFGGCVFEYTGTAGIEDVTVAEDENAPMYNLQGVQVDENYKGIVIKNGKKYLNK
ncbi:hypothetical protein [uncultured Muribaculum sp.]|uniref:hypothetical protein n=1 Tax=uncultured Muribaculum sp. TaxID=1918613 RepID=UPI0025925DC9|nr:hypothetical protein [uncultured Muribaculum sp.]